VASPLELLTDLCFVVAVAQSASEFHHAVVNNHLIAGLVSFMMTFFAIWWAWLNFSWFASAYDNDDVPYRLLTILQIVGALVLAAGIHKMYSGDYILGVVGYVVMRIALVAQWLRAAASDPPHRTTCRRYALGIVLVQACWVGYLFLPPSLGVIAFVVFAGLEFLVPMIAERSGTTPWHPHHIAERYGLFFIIVLGETILSATMAIQGMLNEGRIGHQVICVAIGGVLIVFSTWWIYFSRNAGEALERVARHNLKEAYLWGFGHYFIFASGAALGAGLASRVDYWTKDQSISALACASTVTVPTAILLTALWVVHLRPHDASIRTFGPFAFAVVLALLSTFTPFPEVAAGLVCALLLVAELKMEKTAKAS
jgi:low temperature requirement protein LtrA